jgi:hypothetical protein
MQDTATFFKSAITKKLRRGIVGEAEASGKELSMWWDDNALWETELYQGDAGLFNILPFDVMHTIPLGLVKILVDVLINMSGQAPSQQPEMDARFAAIPRVRDPKQRVMAYRAFPTGITSMKVFTADDLVAILQQLAYVVGTRAAIIRDAETNKAFIAAAFCVRDILVLMKKRSLTEGD